ncbi:hypothetical protein VIGAN_04385600 [Vigna angularis var. angularis]|uniref:Uncharacterized protein n=1 Tax=Vigna angularis var. angularis TaxID=157739 RepID=A0A0S3S042_PHAAN|nr:hypothetical protein VIGAN_04385600 [Vigna angularis var. angularis]
MDVNMKKSRSAEEVNSEDTRKGPWSVEEDTLLQNYVATHGDGRWNSVARCAGLKRSGKSCRLRWLNYLRPDVRRGNITLQEQITILDLHSRWGNRWSKIARHLPGRTDNEIKNYWRTRVLKQARNLKCDVDSEQFKDALRYVWMPRLIERIEPSSETHHPPPVSLFELHPNPTPSLHHQNGLHGSCSGSNALDSSSAKLETPLEPEDMGHNNVSVPGVCENMNDRDVEQGNITLPFAGGDSMESLWDDENLWLMQQLCDDLEIKDNFLA